MAVKLIVMYGYLFMQWPSHEDADVATLASKIPMFHRDLAKESPGKKFIVVSVAVPGAVLPSAELSRKLRTILVELTPKYFQEVHIVIEAKDTYGSLMRTILGFFLTLKMGAPVHIYRSVTDCLEAVPKNWYTLPGALTAAVKAGMFTGEQVRPFISSRYSSQASP